MLWSTRNHFTTLLCELEHELCHFISQITMWSAPELQRSKAQKTGIQVVKYSGVWICAEGTASEESGKESCVIKLYRGFDWRWFDYTTEILQRYQTHRMTENTKIHIPTSNAFEDRCVFYGWDESPWSQLPGKRTRVNRTYGCWDMSICIFCHWMGLIWG